MAKRDAHALDRETTVASARGQTSALRLVASGGERRGERRPESGDAFVTFGRTDVATCVLDHALNLQFFTRSAQDLLGIVAADVGKPFASIALPFEDDELAGDIDALLIHGAAIERDIRARGGRWYKRTVFSYLSDGTATAGVVVSFVDITENKLAALRVDQLTTRERAVIEQVVEGHPNKVIAFKLAISRRTVEYHRQRAMTKLRVTTLADLIRLLMLASFRVFVLTIRH
jgi:DNA-binding CsgD family transcriptional regulator